MSRHRDVRSMNYTDEYDGYDDVYGHSVEDDYCVSPGAEQFMFDRSKQANISSFFTEPDIVEDNEEEEEIPSSYKLPELSELDTAKLMSCIEAIKNVVGDTYPESELNKKIIEFNFNTEAVINSILNDEVSKNEKDNKPVEKNIAGAQTTGSKSENLSRSNSSQSTNVNEKIFSLMNPNEKWNFNNGCEKSDKNQEFSSLSEMISKTTMPIETTSNSSPSFRSLADLTAHHLNMPEKKLNSLSGFSIPNMNFNTAKSSLTNSDATPSFNSLADLTAHHLKISSKDKADSTKNSNSPSGFIIPKISSKSQNTDNSPTSFASLADLTAHHLKISKEANDNTTKNVSSPSGFIIPKIASKNPKSENSPSFGSLAELTAHHLKIEKSPNSPSGFVIPDLSKVKKEKFSDDGKTQNISDSPSGFIIPDLSKVKKEKFSGDKSQDISDSVLKEVSNLNLYEKLDSDKVVENEMDFSDLPNNIIIKKEKLKNINCNKKSNNLLESTIETIRKGCILNCINSSNINLSRKEVSSFGKVLCKTYRRKTPYRRKQITKSKEELKSVIQFDFSSPSPDNLVLSRIIGIKAS